MAYRKVGRPEITATPDEDADFGIVVHGAA